MQRHVPFALGEFYHIYNRGVDKRPIFFSDGDWKHFQFLLFLRNSEKHIKPNRVLGASWDTIDRGETLVDIGVYALMPNHFHLLIHEKRQGGITMFMRKLLTSYSMYMNTKYERTGPLMCRPFRAKHVDSDEYFRWLISYIHTNPLELFDKDWEKGLPENEKHAEKFLQSYLFASYGDYFNGEKRNEAMLLNKECLLVDAKDVESVSAMTKYLMS